MTTLSTAWIAGRSAKRVRRRSPLSLKLVTWAGRVLPTWKKVRSSVLTLAAYSFVNYGIFQINLIAGFIAVGISLFLIDALSGGDK